MAKFTGPEDPLFDDPVAFFFTDSSALPTGSAGWGVTTSVSKTSSDMKLMLYERKTNYLILSRIACVLSHSIVARTQLFLCCS